jgi:predicted YcjX-like family ATPase
MAPRPLGGRDLGELRRLDAAAFDRMALLEAGMANAYPHIRLDPGTEFLIGDRLA